MQQVGVQRAYRIIHTLERTAQAIERQAVPLLNQALERWRRYVMLADGIFLATLLGWLWWSGRTPDLGALGRGEAGLFSYLWLAVLVTGIMGVHFSFRRIAATWLGARLRSEVPQPQIYGDLQAAWRKNTSVWRPLGWRNPLGWGHSARKRLRQLYVQANRHVQALNDRYAQPETPPAKASPPDQA
jgi:hypothetical protein